MAVGRGVEEVPGRQLSCGEVGKTAKESGQFDIHVGYPNDGAKGVGEAYCRGDLPGSTWLPSFVIWCRGRDSPVPMAMVDQFRHRVPTIGLSCGHLGESETLKGEGGLTTEPRKGKAP